MCGILIHRNNFNPCFNVDHRGLETSKIEKKDFILSHSSLPLQSKGTGNVQPIQLDNGDILLFNGEIFNVSEISKYGEDLGYLKNLFKDGLPKKINQIINSWDGFWSIVIYSPQKNRFTCFTDPLGKKQLYRSSRGICSEIKPLIEKGKGFLFSSLNIGNNKTMFDYIYRLLPGFIYELEAENLLKYSKSHYVEIAPKPNLGFESLMDISTSRRIINKIDNYSLFLSGGLDSSVILYHLAKKGYLDKTEILTVENSDDIEIVEKLSKEFGFKFKEVPMSTDDLELGKIVKAYEHPYDIGSLIPQWHLTKAASNSVILTGDGADELFSGYSRAQEKDTWLYDVFRELPYFHHPRIDRMSMHFTKEVRNPFLSKEFISLANSTKWEERKGKMQIKQAYKGKLPDYVLGRKKEPLRLNGDKEYSREKLQKAFGEVFKEWGKKVG